MEEFPLQFHINYKREQSRVITFFKIFLAIPWAIWLLIWQIAFNIIAVLAWFILLFTAQWPLEFFKFQTSYMRYQARLSMWIINLTDSWPPFGGKPEDEYGLTLEIRQIEHYNRWKTGFRFILAFPAAFAGFGVNIYLNTFWFLGAWAIIFSGHLPHWCYKHLANAVAWQQRFFAYQWLLIELFPPLQGMDRLDTYTPAGPAPAIEGQGAPAS